MIGVPEQVKLVLFVAVPETTPFINIFSDVPLLVTARWFHEFNVSAIEEVMNIVLPSLNVGVNPDVCWSKETSPVVAPVPKYLQNAG